MLKFNWAKWGWLSVWGISSLFSAELHVYGEFGGGRIELEEVPFYGRFGYTSPAFVGSPTCGIGRVGGAFAHEMGSGWCLQVRDRYSWGATSSTAELPECEFVEIPPLDGRGSSGLVFDAGRQRFSSSYRENQFDLLFFYTFSVYEGLTLSPGIGYSFLFQWLNFRCEYAGFITDESLRTPYHGARMEIVFEKAFLGPFSLTIIPVFGVYRAATTFKGMQERTFYLEKTALCLQGAFEVGAHYTWKKTSIGIFGFMNYLSYTPTIRNPQTEGEVVQILQSNSFAYGAGASIHFNTLF